MVSASDFFPQDVVERRKYIIEESVQSIFAPDPNGNCMTTEKVTVLGNYQMCIFWQNGGDSNIPYKKILLSLDWLQMYLIYGGYIMNYDATRNPVHIYQGKDNWERRWVIEVNKELCRGYGGAAYNGRSWCAITQSQLSTLIDSVGTNRVVMPQVIFYEMGRGLYNTKLDDIMDWQMEEPSQYGFWTLGFSGAMTVLIPEAIGCDIDYYGTNTRGFREAREKDLATYVSNPQWNFRNTWCKLLLPWNKNQSINDVMSGLLIYFADNFGGITFLFEMYSALYKQPTTYGRHEQEHRARNLVRSCITAARIIGGNSSATRMYNYFRHTLRWDFIDQASAKL